MKNKTVSKYVVMDNIMKVWKHIFFELCNCILGDIVILLYNLLKSKVLSPFS